MATECRTNLSYLKRRILTEIEILSIDFSVWKTINKVERLGLTYLSKRRLLQIARTIRSIQASDIPGDFIEAGCALGGSSVLIATMKNKKKSPRNI